MNEVFLGRFQIFMGECIEVIIFREAILRVSRYQRLGGKVLSPPSGLIPEEVGNMFPPNVGIHPKDYKMPQARPYSTIYLVSVVAKYLNVLNIDSYSYSLA